MNLGTLTQEKVEDFKKALNLKTKELKLGEGISMLFFEIGSEAYYIKLIA